jgi:hypothetical protein
LVKQWLRKEKSEGCSLNSYDSTRFYFFHPVLFTAFDFDSVSFSQARSLELLVDELPQDWLLNTAFWKWLIPQLYREYPNHDMALNFSVSAAPQVELTRNGAKALAATEMTVLVKTNTDFVPVACLSMVGVPLIVLVCYVVPWGIKILFMIYD